MANYANLKAAISQAIKTNGNQEITGQILQNVLNSIVSVIGANYTFAGVATPATNPGTPDQNVFYFATQLGTYSNFGGISITERSLFVFLWNGTWTNIDLLELDDYYQDLDALIAQFEQQLRQMLEDYQPIVIEGDVTNAPDEEDLTSVGNLLRFKNRNTLYGMGCIFLRRELGFAEQLTQENTIYVIRYDYTLTGNVTIPANCVLQFEGGSLRNGTIVGQNTTINAALSKIFDVSCTFEGTFANTPYNVRWFGAKGDGVTDDTEILRHCMTQDDVVIIPRGDYVVSSTIDSSSLYKCCWIGEESIRNYTRWGISSSTNIICKGDNNGNPFLYFPPYVKNINICGEVSDNTQGARPLYDNSIGVQWGTPYRFMSDGVIENVTIQGFGTGINMQECAGTECSRLYLKGNVIGIDFTCEYVENYDSGYNTTLTFNNCIINQQFRYAIIKHAPVLPSGIIKPTDIIIFNSGYIENNAVDEQTDCDILLEQAEMKFNGLYSESTNDYFIKILDAGILNIKGVSNWRINGLYCGGYMTIQDSYLPNAVIHVNFSLLMINSEIKNIEIIRESESDTHNLRLNLIVSRVYDYNRAEWLNYISLPTLNITNAFPTFAQGKGNNYPVMLQDPRSGQWCGIGIWNAQGSVGGPSENNFIDAYKAFTLGVGPTANRPLLVNTNRYGVRYYDTDKKRVIHWSNNNRWETEDNMPDTRKSGTSQERPNGSLTAYDIGFRYFDTTLGKPIFWTGTNWVDATGATV